MPRTEIKLPCPAYRLDGHLETIMETPHGGSAAYHIQLFGYFQANEYRSFPEHARQAVKDYSETLRALLLAGF